MAMSSEPLFDHYFQNLPNASYLKITSLSKAWNWALMNWELLDCCKIWLCSSSQQEVLQYVCISDI